MKRTLILIIWACIAWSCFGEYECEAFDKSREIAKWALFPDLDSTYTFSSDDQELSFILDRGRISALETKECTFKSRCDCRRYFIGYYKNDFHYIKSNIIYDEDGNPIFRPPIFYEFDDIHAYFEVTSTGEIFRMADDTTSSAPIIEFENLESFTIGEHEYQDVLHLSMPQQSAISDYWIVRSIGLVAMEKESILFTIK